MARAHDSEKVDWKGRNGVIKISYSIRPFLEELLVERKDHNICFFHVLHSKKTNRGKKDVTFFFLLFFSWQFLPYRSISSSVYNSSSSSSVRHLLFLLLLCKHSHFAMLSPESTSLSPTVPFHLSCQSSVSSARDWEKN